MRSAPANPHQAARSAFGPIRTDARCAGLTMVKATHWFRCIFPPCRGGARAILKARRRGGMNKDRMENNPHAQDVGLRGRATGEHQPCTRRRDECSDPRPGDRRWIHDLAGGFGNVEVEEEDQEANGNAPHQETSTRRGTRGHKRSKGALHLLHQRAGRHNVHWRLSLEPMGGPQSPALAERRAPSQNPECQRIASGNADGREKR